jgi:hypothetical protein
VAGVVFVPIGIVSVGAVAAIALGLFTAYRGRGPTDEHGV